MLLQLGLAAARSGELDLAADALQRAVSVKPDSVVAWINKARVHRGRGEIEVARDAYTRALLLDPRNEWARLELTSLETAASPRP